MTDEQSSKGPDLPCILLSSAENPLNVVANTL